MTQQSRNSLSVALLHGIVLQTEVEVFPGVRLVPFPPLKRGQEIPLYAAEWISVTGGLYFQRKTQLLIDCSVVPHFNKEHFWQALCLACNSGVTAEGFPLQRLLRVGKNPLSPVPYKGETLSSGPLDPVKVSALEEAKRLYELLEGLVCDVRRKLHIPITRWIKSHTNRSPIDPPIDLEVKPENIIKPLPTMSMVDQMIDLGVTFEALYLSRSGNKSQRLQQRASSYLGKDKADRDTLELEKVFKKIYDLRSMAVHEGKLPTNVEIGGACVPISEFIKQAQDLSRQSIIQIVEAGEFPNWKTLNVGHEPSPTEDMPLSR